jgi:uridine kinase
MIGDRFVISPGQREAALRILDAVVEALRSARPPLVVSISGESGSGKSGVAYCLTEAMEKIRLQSIILAQDDYFRDPPRSNHQKRIEDIYRVGPSEVRLDLMEEHIRALKERPDQPLVKPLVYFDEDRIGSEVLSPGGWQVIIVEGTYASLLEGVDLRVFIDRDYNGTGPDRRRRSRDSDEKFLEKVLAIEHRMISAHRKMADLVIQ